MAVTNGWREALERLRAARAEQEAAEATADVIYAVVDGGVAVGQDAEPAAASIIGDLSRRGGFRIYSLWVLFEIARCVGIWRRAHWLNDTPHVRAAIEHEARVGRILATGLQAYASLMSDSEADVRSIACLLTGLCALEPVGAARLLAEHERAEAHPLAKACARQALLIAVARVGPAEREPALVALLREFVRSGTSEDRGRLRRVIEDHSGVGLSSAAREVLGDTVTGLCEPEGPFWQIEEL